MVISRRSMESSASGSYGPMDIAHLAYVVVAELKAAAKAISQWTILG